MDKTIVFFGSGPVAKSSLLFLSQHFHIEAIITKPATEEEMKNTVPNIPVFSVDSAFQLDDLVSTQLFRSPIGILVDFGVIVSKSVIDFFPLGIVNSHFSLLPEWRGADPITFSVLSGQAKTGVSLMLLEEKMDTGKILVQKSLSIKTYATTPSLTEELIELSNQLLLEIVPEYLIGKIKPREQSHPVRATYSHKLEKSDGIIDWSKSAEQIERQIRAFAGWPGSKTKIVDKEVSIIQAHTTKEKPDNDSPVGTVFIKDKKLAVICSEGLLIIDSLKPAGKNEMTSEAFIAGHKTKLANIG